MNTLALKVDSRIPIVWNPNCLWKKGSFMKLNSLINHLLKWQELAEFQNNMISNPWIYDGLWSRFWLFIWIYLAKLWSHRGNFEIGFETPGAKKKFLGQAWYAYYDLLCTSLTRFNYKRKLGLLQGNFHFATMY